MVQDYRSRWWEETAETKDIKRFLKMYQGAEKVNSRACRGRQSQTMGQLRGSPEGFRNERF